MRFKEFFLFDKQKLALLLFLMFFAPLPVFLILMVGLVPPIQILFYVPILATGPNAILGGLIPLLMFLIATFLAYLISCFLIWAIGKITSVKRIQWFIVIGFGLLLAIISFLFPLYYMAGPGGGGDKGSSYDLYIKSLPRELPKILGCGFAKSGARDMCYLEKAFGGRTISPCRKIQREQTKNTCYKTLAQLKKDPQICDFIEHSASRLGCVTDIAISKNDEKICDYLQSSDDTKSCLSQLRSRNK